MSENQIVSYYFSHLRRGLGASVTPEVGNNDKRATVEVAFKVKVADKKGDEVTVREGDTPQDSYIRKRVALYGPGDILGFDAKKMISKVHPTPDDGNFIANNIPFVEFTEADFLWRYSASKTTNGKWIPWLSLIALKMTDIGEEGEFEFDSTPTQGLPPRIKLKDNYTLPNLSASWRWAHVYCNAEAGLGARQLRDRIKRKPNIAISRLFCARRLKPGTKYCAFVIPTYLLGVEAALGIEDTATSRTMLSWEGNGEGSSPVIREKVLPYYSHFEFRTGLRGDFEEMVRRIEANPIRDLGGKTINIANPGYGFLNEDERTMEIEGALQSSDRITTPMSSLNPLTDLETKTLADLLNSTKTTHPTEGEIRRVVPPVYGFWVNNKADSEVKLDLGTNSELYKSNAYGSWLKTLNLDFRYRIAAGLGVRYVKEHQEELMDAAWAQLERVLRESRIRNLSLTGRTITSIFHKRIDTLRRHDALTYFSFMAPIAGQLQLEDSQDQTFNVISDLDPSGGLWNSIKKVNASSNINWTDLQIPDRGRNLANFSGKPTLQAKLRDSSISNTRINPKLRKYQGRKFGGQLTSKNVKEWTLGNITMKNKGSGRMSVSSRTVHHQPQVLLDIPDFDLLETAKNISKYLDPKVSQWRHRVAHSLAFNKWIKTRIPYMADQQDPLDAPLAFPEFHAPMYKYLLELSEEYFIPGLDKVPQNTVSALVTNRRFIEAFMMGLNHEFASELRWRNYPTDLRGSYFRKFWDSTIFSLDPTEQKQFRKSKEGKQLFQEYGGNDMKWEEIENTFFLPSNRGVARTYEEALRKWIEETGIEKDIRKVSIAEEQAFQASDTGKEMQEEAGLPWPKIEAAYRDYLIAQAYEEGVENWLLTRVFDKDIAPLHTWRANEELGEFSVRQTIAREYHYAVNNWMGLNTEVSPNESSRKAFRVTEEGKQLLQALGLSVDYWPEVEEIYIRYYGQEDDNEVVLLVRAELLQKFPNTFIYMVKAKKDTNDKKIPDWSKSNILYPIFEASLPPDIVCLGFPEDKDTAREHYFIVFEERITEQRYGLDVKMPGYEANDLAHLDETEKQQQYLIENISWTHFDTAVEGDYLDNHPPNLAEVPAGFGNLQEFLQKWESSAPFLTQVFTQKPVRMIVDLADLLPE